MDARSAGLAGRTCVTASGRSTGSCRPGPYVAQLSKLEAEECTMTKSAAPIPTITQAMIDAYDEYTHLTLDRRRFMEQLTRLAGSGAAAAAIAPLLAANSAQAAIVADNDPRVKGEDISYPGSGGEMKGYLVKPADRAGKLGTVIVVHENRGLNPHIRD